MAFSENDIARRRTELQHAPNSDHFKYQKPDVTAPARHGSIDSPTRSTGGSTTGKASGGYTEERIARRRSDLQHGGSDKFAYQRPDFSGFSAPKPASSPIYSSDGAFFPKRNPYEGVTTRRPNPLENIPYSDPLTRAFSQQTGWRDPKAQALYDLAERMQNPQRNTPIPTFRSGPLADADSGPRSRSVEAERQASEAARDALDQAAAGVRFNRTEAEKRRKSNAISFPETEAANDEYSGKMEQRPEWLGGQSVGEYMRDFMNSQEALGTYGADVVREYNRIYDSQGAGAAQKYVMSKDSTGNPGMERIDAFLTGVGNASGINSIAGIAMGPENYRRVASEQQSISKAHPIASAAGAITGTLPLITTLGRFARAIPAIAGLSKAAQAVISGAAAMGGSTAIQEAGAAANGLISPGRFVGDVAVSGLAGIAGGALGNTVSQKGMQFLYNSGLINNSIARTVVAGLSGSGYSVGSTGVREASAFIRDPENYEADPVRIIKDASVAFAFGAISYIANGGTRFTMNEEASNERPTSKWFEDCSTPQEVDAKLRQYARQYHPDQPTGDADLFSEISAEATAQKAWMNVNAGAQAYQKAQEAYASGDTAKYQEAQQEYNAAVNALMVDVQSGAIQGQEAVEALQVLQSVSANLAGPEAQAPATPESDALAALAEQGFPSTAPTTEARLLSTGTENVQVPQDAVATSQQDIPGNPYERTAAQKLDTAARQLQALEYERSQHPSVEQLNDELNSPFAVFENKNPEIAQIQTQTGEQKLAALAAQATANQAEQKNAQIRAIYEAGRTQNPDFQSIMDGATMLTEAEKTNAFYRGLSAAATEAAGIGKEISYGGQQPEEGSYLPGEGSGRPVSLGAGEPVGEVSSEAGRAPQGWKNWTAAADAGIKGDAGESVALKSGVAAEKILRTAEPGQVIYEVESGHTPSMRKAAAMVSAYDSNIEIVPFVSERDILVSEGESVRAFADPMTRRIGYRANDERATGEQLGKHELIEFGIIDGKIDVPEALSYLTSEFKSLGIGELVDRIATAYMNGEASPSLEALRYANKEMLCDIGAGINQFEGVKGYEVLSDAVELAHDRLHDYMNEKLGGAFEAEYDETTAPAATAEIAAGTGTEATAPSRIVGESPKVEITDKNVSVDSIVPTITEMPKNLPEYSSTLYREPAQKELFTLSNDGKISIKEKLNMSGRDFLIKQMKEKGYRDKKNTLAWLDKTADFMDKAEAVYTYIGLDDIKNTKIVIDPRSGNIVLRALVKNGEYPVNIDLTKECTRRIALGKFVDWLSRNAGRKGGKTMLEEVPLTASNLVMFNKILKDEGFDTACLGCFVETRRYRIQEWADSFIEKYNKAVEKSNPGAGYFNFADKDVYVSDLSKKDLADLNEALESYKASVKEERSAKKAFAKAEKERLKSIGATKKQIDSVKSDLTNEEQINALVRSNKIYQKKLRVSDLITPGGRTVLHRDFPELESLVLGHYGSNTPKSVELFTPYNYDLGSILSVGSQTLRDYVKPIGGAREQSFSDSVPTHLMDQMEKTADMAVNKLPDHIYTKIPSEVLLFGLTKRKFNMSIMFNIDPNVDSAHAGLRADGSYFVGDRKTSELEARAGRERTFVQSFPYDMARKIQHMPGYSENCGMIGVGYSYFHIRKMLADPEFGYIIGYHPSGMNGELASASHIDKATSYEPVQNTLKINGLRHVTGELDGLPSYASWPQGIKTTDNKMIEKTKLTMKDFDMKGNLKKYGGKETMRRFLAWLEENRLTVDTSKASYKGVEQHGVGSFPLYEDLARTKDYRKTADNYIAWCLENDMLPEFFEFADDDNYFNFIYDFTTYDHNTGKYSPQVPVQMNFPGNFFRLAAHSLNQWNNYMMRQDPKEIPTFEKMYNEAAQQLHYSSKLDISGNKDSDGNNLTVGQEEYFKDSKVRDSNGNLKVMYHGTGRADRVGTVFDPNRATSGPMAYFTDDKTIAENYARDKQDTSLTKEGAGDYHRMYRMNIGGNTYTIEDAWDKLPTRKRVEIRKKAPHITLDDDGEEIIFSNDTNRGLGNFDNYLINSNGGNYIKALIESWLDDGTLYGEEERFKEVLSLVGLDDVEYLDPEYRDEKVYAVYLNVTNPLNTSDIPQDVIDNLRDASENATWTGPDSNVDNWDKTNISPSEWFSDFENDLENGTAYVWTRIPDWVTDTLKDMGYDGISDMGGKGGGATHNVVIPFSSNQIKNIDNANPTENEDIRYSSKLDLSGAKDSSGKTMTAQQAEYFKDSKARDAEGRLLTLYHGTEFAGFTEFKTERGVWLTTSKRDADSYGGNWEGKVFDPNEKPEIRRTNGKTYPVGEHMQFETEEDRDNFLKEYPDAESYLTERELRVKEAELEDDWEADDYDERSEELQELRKRSEKIGRAYARYELKHSGSTTIGEMLEDPSLYSLNDFKRVWLSIDREVSFDDEFEYYDSDEEYRDAIAERLRNYIEEGADDQEWHDEMLNDFAVKARIPEGKAGEIFNNTNNRTYELYANVVNPYVFDNHGRGSEFNGTFYHTIEEAMADPQYDGVIVENARVGRYQDLGTVVLVKNPNQVKLTSNENPTENDDIRYSSKLQLQQKRDEDYSAAIRENDTETAARLVKEAAEAAGYTEDIYHGTGAFGFTKFDLGKMDDGASIFATTDRRVAESYSGETNRELISKRAGESVDAIIDRIDGAKDEDLLPLIKENLDPKYKRVPQERLAEMRDERVNDIRFYADKIMDFMDDNPGMFDETKSIAASRLASSLYKLSRAQSADEVDEYLRQYNDDVWELKFMDEDAFYEMFDGSSGIAATNNAIRELNTLLESDVMFTNGEKKPGSTLDVLTPGEARTRLIGEMSKGIYHLYGKNENMLEFDANGDNWNMIDTARISNKAFRIKSTSNKDKAWLSGLYMPFNDAQSLAARAARDVNGEDDYLDVKDLRDPLGRISGWEFRSHKTGDMVMELESALPSRAMTRDIAKYAREVGYDGVIMRNLKDSGGATAYNQPSDVYIYFKPNAVKSADTVTYDDGGNAIPLSERFKTGEDDIRYSSKLDLRRKQERDNEYMDAVNTGDIAKAAKMVSKAAEEAGFKNAIPEQTLAYKVRTGKAPTKTKKVYKVFTVAPDGSPTALFVSGTQKLPQGVWLDAQDTWHFTAKNGEQYVPSTQNPYTEGGKTGGSVEIPSEEIRQELIKRGFLPEGSKAKKVTALAYRPGWHAGDLPFFPQGGKQDNEYISESNRAKANKEVFSGTEEHPYKNYHRYNQVVFECEMAFDKDYTKSHIGSEKGKASYGKVVYEDMQEMPVDGGYKFATNPMANANDIGSWFISGSLKIGRALSQEECDTILRQNGRLPQLWEQGKLDLASLGYTGPQKDAARKTLAPVTYDDEGNVIPLSARFDPDVDDVRYSTKLNLQGKEIELTEREEKLMDQLNEGYLKRIEQVTAEKDAQIEKLKEQMKAAVGAEKQKAREQIAKIRKEKNERIAYLEKQWRQNTNWQIAELKKKAEAKRGEEHDDMIRRLAKLQAEKDQKIEDILANHRRQRQEARDRRNDRKLRVKFQKLARKALRESQNKPGLASERVQELLKDIDLTALGMRDDTRTSLHNKLLEIMEMRKTDENYLALHAEQDWKKVERLFKKQIKDMSLEEVNDLITELSALCHYQETTDRLIKDEQNRTAAEVGRQIVKDLKELTPLDITNPVKVLSAKYLRDNLSPDRAFNRLSGYKRDSAMRSLYRQVLDGYTKVKEFEKKSDELFDGFRNDPKNKEFLKNGAKQTIPVTSKYGQTALISPAMRVSLYMASRNRDNLRHISTDGMTVPEPKAYAKGLIEDAYGRGATIVLDPVDVNKVCANMTESEKEFASLLETFFDGYAKEAINDTSVELDGILKAIVDHYFPIASDKNFLAKSMDSFQDPTLEGWNNLKARQENANNKILLEDARQVLQRHIRNTARYYGLAIPMRNWNKVYGYTSHRDEDTGTRNSVQSAIKNAWNSDTADYIERLIRDDINSGGRKAERGVMDSMRSAYAGTTLTLNAGVALKQTTSYFMAGSILDMESLMYGLSHKFKKTDQEYMDSITPWGWARRQGESTIELGEMARRRDPITRNTPNWNQAMDVITTNALFTAAERSIQKDYPDLKRGDKKYDDALAERYNQVLWRTQPQYESAFRPEYLRKTDIGSRTFGMFKTESMQMSGELIDAWGQWKADEKRAKSGGEQEKRWKSESSKQFYKTFASWLASNMCFAMMGTALDIVMFHKGKPYRNERGEVDWQTIAAKTGANFVGSALGGYFFAGTAFSLGSYLFNIISGEKATWYDIEVPGISLINDMVTNTGNWVGTMIDEEASPSAKAKATSKFVLSASKFTPLGFAGNLLKLADSLNLYIQDIREGIKTGDWHLYEAGDGFLQDTSPTKDQYANQAVYYAGQGNAERAGRALKRTKTGNLEKAIGRKIGDVMFSRFTENPQDLVSYMETISKNGGTPRLSDVPDRGFSSFTKLKEGLGSPNRNENWHHIVEQQQGPGDNNFGTFSSTQINNANNVISIPSGAGSVHKAITDYYDSVQDFTDGMTVREWLAENKTFEEQFDFGIEQLRKYGEVAPTERGWVFIPNEEKINAIPLKEGKDKELTATQKQWDTMMAEAREDGGLTDREIRAAALQMLNEGVPKDEVIELYKSKKNDKYIDEWMKYDGESGGDLGVYFGFMNAKSLGNQDGAAEYLNESGLPDEDKWALWELVNWSEASYDKKVE